MKNNHAPENPDIFVTSKQTVYDGYFSLDEYRIDYRRFDGGLNKNVSRLVLERGHAVAVLPYDPVADVFVFIEQFRAGALAAGWEPWLLEIVAGIIDEGETPDAVAKRETAEETGLQVIDMQHIMNYLPTPGGCSETVALYIARVDSTKAAAHAGLDEENEDIQIRIVDRQTALDLLDKNGFNNSAILTAMQWFALNQDKIRNKWPNTAK